MDKKGGRYTIDAGDGKTLSGRGEARIRPARATPTTGVNQDGSGYATVAPQLSEIELSLDRGVDRDWVESELLRAVNVTFEEIDTGKIHFLTSANWDGRPEINSASGEVTGMKFTSDRYRVTGR